MLPAVGMALRVGEAEVKATVQIEDALLRRAKRLAAERNTTLRAIVESALRHYLEGIGSGSHPPFRLRRHTFRGKGLQPGLDEHDWATIRERVYEGRGG